MCGHDDDRDGRVELPDPTKELDAVHAREAHVAEHDVRAHRLQQPQRLLRVAGHLGLVAGLGEERLDGARQGALVVDDQDGRAAHAAPSAGSLEPDGRALARPARDLQPPAVLLDVPLGDREAQPGPFLAGGEERLAHRRQHVRWNAAAGVADLDDDLRAGVIRTTGAVGHEGADPEPAARGHRVERVGDDLEDRLLELHRIDPDLRQARRDGHLQVDVLLADAAGPPPAAARRSAAAGSRTRGERARAG